MPERVLIIGASNNEDRYANKAQRMLTEHGHSVVPVNPKDAEVLGVPTVAAISDTTGSVDTVTVYVRPQILMEQLDALIALRPKRVIFNPGTEHADMETLLKKEGIEPVEACTLVLLRTGQF